MKVDIAELIIRTIATAALFALLLFVPAGSITWWAGWTYLVLVFGFSIGLTLWLLRFNPDLLAERLSGIGKPDQKAWDKVFLAFLGIVFFVWLVLMPLDAMRFRWSHVPPWVQWIGALVLCASFYIFYLTFRENTYLSPAVRVQKERGQTVINTGPYRYVRHPLYGGFILFVLGTTLLLGSGYGVFGALILIVMIAWRAVQEERVLLEELPGYSDYMSQVRYRLVPYIW